MGKILWKFYEIKTDTTFLSDIRLYFINASHLLFFPKSNCVSVFLNVKFSQVQKKIKQLQNNLHKLKKSNCKHPRVFGINGKVLKTQVDKIWRKFYEIKLGFCESHGND